MSRTSNQPSSLDPVELLLRRILRSGVRSALLGGAASLALGCSDPMEIEGEPLVCASTGRVTIAAAGLTTTAAFDYLALRNVPNPRAALSGEDPDAWTLTASEFRTLSERGQACATASSPECADKLTRHPDKSVQSCFADVCQETSVVTTRGDQVQRWQGPEPLRALLVPIDSPDEAVLLAQEAGYTISCGDKSGVLQVDDGYDTYGTRVTESCQPIVVKRFRLHVSTSGEVSVIDSEVIQRDRNACIGRVPAGLTSHSLDRHESALGDYLAGNAHLEAASVVAFERLARELSEHGAPRSMVAAALGAAADEVRHARVMTELARAHHGEPSELRVATLPLRALEEIALENATEGCVRETFGALVGAYQAEHAEDLTLRSAMRSIAEDEARHASLSQRVHAWALDGLCPAARERVLDAQREAIEALALACEQTEEPTLRRLAGLPPASVARAWLADLRSTLWREAAQHAA